MTQDPSSAPVPAGLNGNTPPARQTAENTRETADGVAQIAGMLPQMAQAFGGLLAQLPAAIGANVRGPQRVCAQCVVIRVGWEAAHLTELKKAIADAMQAHGLPEGAAPPPGLDPAPFMPEQLRPGGSQGMPQVNPAITSVNGTECCAAHVPGAPGGRTLLVANASLSSSLLSQFAA